MLDRCNGWGDMGLVVVAPVGGEEADLALHAGEPDFEDGGAQPQIPAMRAGLLAGNCAYRRWGWQENAAADEGVFGRCVCLGFC